MSVGDSHRDFDPTILEVGSNLICNVLAGGQNLGLGADSEPVERDLPSHLNSGLRAMKDDLARIFMVSRLPDIVDVDRSVDRRKKLCDHTDSSQQQSSDQ